MKRLYVERVGDFELVLHGPNGNERLAIEDPEYPRYNTAKALFAQLGLMHLIAPFQPKVIKANFQVNRPIRRLIGQMYAVEGRHRPIFDVPPGEVVPSFGAGIPTDGAVVAYSAGKDSLWNMWWAQNGYGPANVVAAHISGLNRSNACYERKYTKLQSEKLGFPYVIIPLKNSSSNSGYLVMRSRDIFLTGILVPIALQYRAKYIITEGFAEATPTEPFSGREDVMVRFNEALRQMGIPVQVRWRNLPEMDVVRELLDNTRWLPYVHNCFSAPCYKPGIRRSWIGGTHKGKKVVGNAPTFPLYDSQCGSCVKCRITNLARVLHDPSLKRSASKPDIVYFVRSTVKWVKERSETHSDMVTDSFLRDLKTACAEYGVPYDIKNIF